MGVYRLTARRYAKEAFAGEGAMRYGGRWNPRGVRVIYTASTLSLAALELLVHLDREDLPADFVSIAADVPDTVRVEHLRPSELPGNWREYPAPTALAAIGLRWLSGNETAVLSVPSVVIPAERLYLLNPAHTDFRLIKRHVPEPFVFNARLRRQ